MNRIDSRKFDEPRTIKITPPIQKNALGSVIIEIGNTIVNCSASFEERVPPFLNPETDGWLTCEYSMLPTSTSSRVKREASKGKQTGRTVEIQRLIGRSLRSVLDLSLIPGKTLWIDCDVLQADGGTRTASISGASVAIAVALKRLLNKNLIEKNPLKEHIAAISLGIVDGEILLDLNYQEDSSADVDMNLIMTESLKFVEVQASSEGNIFTEEQFAKLLNIGKKGIEKIIKVQKEYLSNIQ